MSAQLTEVEIVDYFREGRVTMPEQWSAQIVGRMHLYGITAKQLAAEVGWHDKYLSAVLNGHRTPRGAEAALTEALERLIAKGG